MSQLTHAQPRFVRPRLSLRLSLAAVALIAGAAIALFFVILADDDAIQSPTAAVSDTAAGIRYDGGPEEGTRDVTVNPSTGFPQVAPPASSIAAGSAEAYRELRQAPPATRYDGGPEEGTSGVHGSSPGSSTTPGIRYDGGPEEGSALAR